MALTPRLATAAAGTAAEAVGALLNAGFLDLYDGTQPATADTAITTQVKLARLTFSSPAFGSPASGTITAAAITSDTAADATGTATWFRAVTSAGVAVCDGSVGTSGANLNLSSVSIVVGGSVAVTSFTYTQATS